MGERVGARQGYSRERIEIRPMIHTELQRCPTGCQLSYRVKFPDIHLANTGEIVVADEYRVGEEIDHLVQALARLRTIPYGIAQIPDSLHLPRRSQNSFKCDQVRMNVGDDQNFHW